MQTYYDLVEAIQEALKVANLGVLVIYKYLQEVGNDYARLQDVFKNKLMVYLPTLKESCGPEHDAFNHLRKNKEIFL